MHPFISIDTHSLMARGRTYSTSGEYSKMLLLVCCIQENIIHFNNNPNPISVIDFTVVILKCFPTSLGLLPCIFTRVFMYPKFHETVIIASNKVYIDFLLF